MGNIFIIFILTITVFSCLLMIYAIVNHSAEKALFLISLSVSIFLYTFGFLLEATASSLEAAFYGVRIQKLGSPFILPVSYLFIRDVYGEKRFGFLKSCLLTSVPFITLAAFQAYPFLRLYYTDITYIHNGYIASCRGGHGPLYYLGSAWNYVCFFLCFRLILIHLKNGNRLKRRQSAVLLAALFFPLVAAGFYSFSYLSNSYDPNPFTLSISLSLLVYSVLRQNLLSPASMARLQVIESLEDAFIVCDNELNFLDANKAAKRLFPQLNLLEAGESLKQVKGFKEEGKLHIQSENEMRSYKATQTKILQTGKDNTLCIVFRDITEEEALLKKLRAQAMLDPMMQIYNRGAFFDLANFILESGKKELIPCSLLLLDLDHFKRVNDTYGHPCGDAVLKAISEHMKKQFKKTGLIGRYGGEEIAVLMKDISPEQAVAAAEELRKSIENIVVSYKGAKVTVTASIGVVYCPGGTVCSLEYLLGQADSALYQAKHAGRNRVCLYESPKNLTGLPRPLQ
ncbi:MAG: diguanylate cyclase [Lacrimispora sp.]|uniref:histidine kinase N-terminal 7TM domain-containing diguanylate cyclase n=1 Tax=Lacrimispora sp. TaxID=2719234 RepID=UPI0039E5C691